MYGFIMPYGTTGKGMWVQMGFKKRLYPLIDE